MKRKLTAVLLAMALLLAGCGGQTKPLSRSSVALDTAITLSLYDKRDPALLSACFDKISAYEALFSRTDPLSEIAALNAANGAEVTLSDDTKTLLAIGREYGERTDGAFDVTIAPVSTLWDFTAETPALPDVAVLAEAAARVDYRALTMTATGAQLPAGYGVDLGGIAKGYIADRLADYLRGQGVTSALLDLGGNIYALGDRDGQAFSVGIADPRNPASFVAVVRVSDRSVVTSGVYERGFTLDGVRYHHLLDPATGWPMQNELASVTIVSERSVDGDALSTACFVMGLTRGMELIEQTDGVEALFIGADGTLHPSSGLVYEEK